MIVSMALIAIALPPLQEFHLMIEILLYFTLDWLSGVLIVIEWGSWGLFIVLLTVDHVPASQG